MATGKPSRLAGLALREGLYEDTGGYCSYCCRKLWPINYPYPARYENRRLVATIDHKHPRSRGGTWDYENLAICCAQCNSLKGDLTLAEFEEEVAWAIENDVPLKRRGNGYMAIFYSNEIARTARSSVG